MHIAIYTYGNDNGLEHEKVALSKGATRVSFRSGQYFKPINGLSIDFDCAVLTRSHPQLEQYLTDKGIPILNLETDSIPEKTPESQYPVWLKRRDGIFTGRRVALIGPAEHITKNKVDFDKYDLICRMNWDGVVSPALAKATTSRIDVWYPSAWNLNESPQLFNDTKAKHIRWHRLPDEYRRLRSRYSKKNFNASDLKDIVGCYPNNGIVSMLDILAERPEELYVAGIDFYTGKNPYRKGYAPKEQFDNHVKTKGNIGTHDQPTQIAFFKQFIAPFIKMDKVLEGIANA